MCHNDVLLSILQKPVLLPLENLYPQPRVRVEDFYSQKTPVIH